MKMRHESKFVWFFYLCFGLWCVSKGLVLTTTIAATVMRRSCHWTWSSLRQRQNMERRQLLTFCHSTLVYAMKVETDHSETLSAWRLSPQHYPSQRSILILKRLIVLSSLIHRQQRLLLWLLSLQNLSYFCLSYNIALMHVWVTHAVYF